MNYKVIHELRTKYTSREQFSPYIPHFWTVKYIPKIKCVDIGDEGFEDYMYMYEDLSDDDFKQIGKTLPRIKDLECLFIGQFTWPEISIFHIFDRLHKCKKLKYLVIYNLYFKKIEFRYILHKLKELSNLETLYINIQLKDDNKYKSNLGIIELNQNTIHSYKI